jgi:hypothetical protein
MFIPIEWRILGPPVEILHHRPKENIGWDMVEFLWLTPFREISQNLSFLMKIYF